MITTHQLSDIIHIMKMNRFSLSGSDTAELCFNGQFKEKDYQITILVLEGLPQISIMENEAIVVNETMKSIDDLKIFLEEQLYKYMEV